MSQIKIVFTYVNMSGNYEEELLWSKKVNIDTYEIDNIPFFAPNIALGDHVKVEEENGILYYLDLVKESGHSTIQLIFLNRNSESKIIESLEKLGCEWDKIQDQPYYAIDISPDLDYKPIKALLENNAHNCDYKEACLSHSLV